MLLISTTCPAGVHPCQRTSSLTAPERLTETEGATDGGKSPPISAVGGGALASVVLETAERMVAKIPTIANRFIIQHSFIYPALERQHSRVSGPWPLQQNQE